MDWPSAPPTVIGRSSEAAGAIAQHHADGAGTRIDRDKVEATVVVDVAGCNDRGIGSNRYAGRGCECKFACSVAEKVPNYVIRITGSQDIKIAGKIDDRGNVRHEVLHFAGRAG